MFLNILTDRQKQSFLALATKVIMADGGVVPAENVTLDVRRREMGGDIMAPPEEIYGEPNFEIFDTQRARMIVMLELLVLAYSDDEYHVDEKPIIQQLAEAFGYSHDEMKKFEHWAVRQAPLSVEGWALIEAKD